MNLFKKFLSEEDAAVTVDWVVLTGAIVLLGFVVIGITHDSIVGHGNSVETHLTTRSVGNPNGG
ncbi:MAG: pilus assembly protein [Silicimonas sp.]|nr:pilus assembly protein [Silicimonas sp.]NNF92746.1 pilus assembly protein [Boseongicola sp.]NNL73803.1 pilus assembly protein [Silicimonas sp.]